jgi:TolA-binding protein
MKKTSLALLLSACSNVYAELPPVIDHSSYPPSASPVNPANSPSSNTLYELMRRLEQMQAEVQQLTGKVDEQAYRIDELKKHQTKMYSDFDERLQTIENNANGTEEPVAESPPDAVGTGDAEAKEGESSVPATESAPAPESTPVDNPVSASEPAPAVESAPAPKPKPETTQVSGPEKQEYQQAIMSLETDIPTNQ